MAIAVIIGLIGVASLVLAGWLAGPEAPIRMLDQPNERSLHATPTPRSGGLAICAALALGWLAALSIGWGGAVPANILLGAAVVALVSLIDDRYALSPGLRLLVHLGATMILVRNGFVIPADLLPGPGTMSEWIATSVTVAATLWLINLYNFMDGMDGFAGGMAVIGFGTLAILGWEQGDAAFAAAALAVCAAAAGFLWFNFPPARIFMGDSGSTTLGFLVAAFTVWGSRRGLAPAWLILVVFSPFIIDATVTLLKRALRGEAVWRAHRTHYYQRLVRLGWGHRRTVLAEYVVMIVCAAASLAMVDGGMLLRGTLLVAVACLYLGAAVAVHRMERKR